MEPNKIEKQIREHLIDEYENRCIHAPESLPSYTVYSCSPEDMYRGE